GNHGEAVFQRERLVVALESGAVVEVVLGLQRLVARQAEALARRHRFPQARGRVLRGADRAHLAGLHEAGQRLERLLDGRRGIVRVGLVEVDAVGLQPPQRGLDVLLGLRAADAFLAFHGHADLGRDEHAVALAAAPQPLADDRLRLAALVPGNPGRVRVRGVDEVEAQVDEAVEDREGGGLVGGPAENVATEGEGRGIEAGAAEGSLVHGSIIRRGGCFRMGPWPSSDPPGNPARWSCSSTSRGSCATIPSATPTCASSPSGCRRSTTRAAPAGAASATRRSTTSWGSRARGSRMSGGRTSARTCPSAPRGSSTSAGWPRRSWSSPIASRPWAATST